MTLAACVALGSGLSACTPSNYTSPQSPRPTSTSLRTTSTPAPTPSVDPEVALAKVAILRNVSSTWPSGKMMNLEDGIHRWFYSEFGRYNGGWVYTLSYMAIWWCVLLVLYRKRWFLRV